MSHPGTPTPMAHLLPEISRPVRGDNTEQVRNYKSGHVSHNTSARCGNKLALSIPPSLQIYIATVYTE
ncbi:hypothetical protein J6590_069560 [Homalodisca vitripennis]|nr:hypothetical protein J6590_069560 [Homalodisca vitripennis]